MKVLVFGEILWDIIEGEYHLGGAPLNFAAHARKCGQESGIISSLGEDDLGNRALDLVNKLDVDTSMVQRSSTKPTGTVPVELHDGQPEYEILTEVAFDYVESEKLDADKIRDYDTFYFGTLTQRNEVSRESLYHILDNFSFEKIFYDVNLRKDCYSKETILKSLSYCTMLKVNDDEVEEIGQMIYGESLGFEAFSQKVTKQFPNIEMVIITAGPDGCLIYKNGDIIKAPGVSIKVKDTVGAGDSFSAAFLCTYYKTNDAVKAGTVANQVGGFVASSDGPIPEYSAEIKAIL